MSRVSRSQLSVLLLSATLVACNSGDPLTGPAAENCGAPPYFSVLPVEAPDFSLIVVIGGLAAPGHTLPTAHAGLMVARVGTPVRVPGDMQVTEVRRVTYLTSPIRQGQSDYAVFFFVCRQVSGWFGHVMTLSSSFPASVQSGGDCETYSTSDETVQTCVVKPKDLHLSAGSSLGTAGAAWAAGLDFGMVDTRLNHFYVNPSRFSENMFHAACGWEQFEASLQSVLFSKLRDPGNPSLVPAGTPRCGTMEVDVANTAKGVWAEQGVTGQVGGDERRYITLADYPYRPQEMLAMSLAPDALGAKVALVPRMTTGRVNLAFENVPNNNTVHCYTRTTLPLTESWLLAVNGSQLRIQRVTHTAGAGPCNGNPATWTLGATAITMVR